MKMSAMGSLNIAEVTTMMLPSNGTDIIVHKEMEVETVIVILWISGGILLVALLILLACILRTNKKGRRRSSPLRPGVFRVLDTGNSNVNPSYTSYDEIWTWIPVVRGNEDSCPPRTETSRNVTISPASTTPQTSALEPPPYSVAISTPSRPYGGQRYTSPSSTSYGNPVSSIATIQSFSNDRSLDHVSVSQSPVTLVTNSFVQGRGETESVNTQVRTSSIPHNMTSTPRQSPITTPRTPLRERELTQSPITHSNIRNVVDSGRRRPRSHYQNRDVRSPLPNRRSFYEADNSCAIEAREPNTRIHRNNQGPVTAVHTRDEMQAFTYDPEERVYSYVPENLGRRIWCDIPPSLMDEDGPPPYTRDHNGLGSREYFQRRARSDRPAPIVRLEYDYF